MSELPEIKIDPAEYLEDYNKLPALPTHILELQQILSIEDVNINRISRVVSNDPALVAQVLKMVNSAYFGIPREVSDINLAVGFLGIHEIYRIAISFAVIDSIKTENKFLFEKIWAHSIYTALIAKHLKHIYKPFLSEGELWVAAILHDIGKFVYLKFYPDHLKAAMELSEEEGILYREAEKRLQLPSHSVFGTILCDRWKLPTIVQKTILTNAALNPSDYSGPAEKKSYARLVMVANLMAILSADKLNHASKLSLTEIICKELDCDEEKFLVMMAEIYELRERVSRLCIGDQSPTLLQR